MKKYGIAIDNWKRAGFESALHAAGFTDFEVTVSFGGTKLIQVNTEESRFKELMKLVQRTNFELKNRN